jgi:hypothetical protein
LKQIDDGPDQGQSQNPKQHSVEHWDELAVIRVILSLHC